MLSNSSSSSFYFHNFGFSSEKKCKINIFLTLSGINRAKANGKFEELTYRGMQVYLGLHSRVGLMNLIADDFSWTLLRGIHDDQKVPSAQWLAVKAECNSKLSVALSIMEECFVSMVDPRTGIDMIPHVLYNWG